ncbi:predicted protein [Chaetomium globosum CBS 148.51]|uniref:Uncharacterized protein n=1 Tax=Chaetomium globosum (strain ATCC 6205 / CBS 148.51 / DSM 1962 / NBRC 6347 / NRRL 1970) TaxID=306901 RepID=Q2HGT8_CHAGB|nr:uncharacterized protein CHGG_00566 [Chaetomium globosum CBS 148.51]EAQ92331.1 predicted protein [Chaetomium globosum CBS 148.51]
MSGSSNEFPLAQLQCWTIIGPSELSRLEPNCPGTRLWQPIGVQGRIKTVQNIAFWATTTGAEHVSQPERDNPALAGATEDAAAMHPAPPFLGLDFSTHSTVGSD